MFKSKHALKGLYGDYFMPPRLTVKFKSDVFSKREDQQYDELTYENLNGAFNVFKAMPKEESKCLILDDMGAYLKTVRRSNF
jgi:hypothetical protein